MLRFFYIDHIKKVVHHRTYKKDITRSHPLLKKWEREDDELVKDIGYILLPENSETVIVFEDAEFKIIDEGK